MMNLHRLNTHNLPAIRSLDGHHVMDTSSDFPASPQSPAQRSMPLPIPLSKSSPTSSRGVSFASQGVQVPPILSLNPPPMLSLDPPSLPSSHHQYHHDDDSTEDWDDSEGNERVHRRKESRGGGCPPSGDWRTRTSRKYGDPQYDPPGSFEDFSIKNENSFPKYWQNDFSRKSPKHTKELSRPIANIGSICNISLDRSSVLICFDILCTSPPKLLFIIYLFLVFTAMVFCFHGKGNY